MATQYEYTPSSDNLVTYRQPSDNSNGNFLDNDGKTLLTCEHANRVLSKTDLTSGERTVIASEFGGSPLTSPNDGLPQRFPAQPPPFCVDKGGGCSGQSSSAGARATSISPTVSAQQPSLRLFFR